MTPRLAAAIARVEAAESAITARQNLRLSDQPLLVEESEAWADLRAALDERVRELPAFADREGWEMCLWLVNRLT